MRRPDLLAALAAAVALASLAPEALAQPSLAPPGGAPGEMEPTVADPGIDVAVRDDVLAGRGWMSPTAFTQPEGTATFSYLQLGPVATAVGTWGAGSNMNITGLFMKPMGEDGGLYMLSGKIQVVSKGTTRIALQGGLTFFDEGTSEQVVIMGAGAAASFCLDPLCHSFVSGYLGTAKVPNEEERPVVATATAVIAITPRVKFVGELDHGFVLDDRGDSGTLGWLGGRITSGSFAFDLGLVRPLEEGSDEVLPMIGLTYRTR